MQLETALQTTLQPTATLLLANRDALLDGVVLAPDLVDKRMDYLQALTDDAARDLSRATPVRVPSRLPIDRP
jgi:hypothetical protein